jgi:undecaprenyl-diphosphatase
MDSEVLALVSVIVTSGLVAYAGPRLLVRRARRRGVAHALEAPPAIWAGAGLAVIGLAIFVFIAEDVVSREPAEVVLRLDQIAQRGVRWIEARPGVHQAAVTLSDIVGPGLGVLVPAGAAWLVWLGRPRQAAILVAGITSAWMLSVGLKIAFAIPRPPSGLIPMAFSGYGFPSGHALVVTVAATLVAWLAGRGARVRVRRLLAIGAAGLIVLTVLARLVLHAHWLSDVLAGATIGGLWVGGIVWLETQRGRRTR